MSKSLTMSRRSFVKTAAITAGAAAALDAQTTTAFAESTYPEVIGNDTVVVKTCCRGCGKMECGVKVVVQNGRAIRVEGDEGAWQSMGNCCTKSQSSIQAAYHPDRLHYPMKRTNPKGEEPGWVRISWDEALDTIVDNLREITAKYGGEAIACQVGTSRIWCMHSESILKNMLETPNNIEAWQICKGPRHFAGTMVSGFGCSWMETIERPKVYVQWGGASEMSNYDDSCRTTVDVASRADVHISVDPRMANICIPRPTARWHSPGPTSSSRTTSTTICTSRSGPTPRSSSARTSTTPGWTRTASRPSAPTVLTGR